MQRPPRFDRLALALGSEQAASRLVPESLPRHVERLLRWPVAEPRFEDALACAKDLMLANQVEGDSLRAILPPLLWAWTHDLTQVGSPYGGFSEHFWSAVAGQKGFEPVLTPAEFQALGEFVGDSLLDRMAMEDGSHAISSRMLPSSWFRAFCCYGIAFPHVSDFWSRWTRFESRGHALCLAQYVSCIVYNREANPVFAGAYRASTGPRKGPSLWEPEGFLIEPSWRAENLDFIRTAWSPQQLRQALANAVETLATSPMAPVLADLGRDYDSGTARVEARLAVLPERLAKCDVSDWPD